MALKHVCITERCKEISLKIQEQAQGIEKMIKRISALLIAAAFFSLCCL